MPHSLAELTDKVSSLTLKEKFNILRTLIYYSR